MLNTGKAYCLTVPFV